QRKILELVLQNPLEEAEAAYRQLYEHHGPLLRFLKEASGPPPKALYRAAEFVLNADLQRAFENEELNLAHIENLLREARLEGISLETTSLEFGLRKTLERLAAQLAADPSDFGVLQRLEDATTLVSSLPFQVDLWRVQNICYEMLQTVYEEYQMRAQQGHEEARAWLLHFNTIALNLTVRV
ncbi:MAG: glycoside hydrolase, partial [Syntrophobacteria bacterium]